MRINNENLLTLDGVTTIPNIATSQNLKATYIGHAALASVQLVLTGAPVGVIKVQASCDVGSPNSSSEAQQSANVSNWSDTGLSVAVSAAGTFFINIVDPGYYWIRVVYTATSGTGTISSARLNVKGV